MENSLDFNSNFLQIIFDGKKHLECQLLYHDKAFFATMKCYTFPTLVNETYFL